MAAKEILGNLIQYNLIDHETVPLKYNILARNYVMMKLQGISPTEIQTNMKKLQIDIERPVINKLMKEIEDDSLISIKKKGKGFNYELNKELILSPQGEKQFISTIQPLISWPTQFWRSFYNVRELNITPNNTFQYRDFLVKVLAKSATQGFSAIQFVFKNLIKYYEKIKEEGS